MFDNLVCPVSFVQIDRNVVRINGLTTTLLLSAYVYTRWPWIIILLAADYMLRAMLNGPMSPMAHFSRLVSRTLGIRYRAMDKAPKVFASRIGVCFATGAAITHFVAPSVAPWLAGTLAVFTTLESVFDFCFGCVVYTYIAIPLYKARNAVLSVPLFRKLEDRMLVALAEGFQTVRFAENEQIVVEGEPGDAMFVLTKGEVEVYHGDPIGDKTVVTTYKKGNFFGEMAMLSGAPRVANVGSMTLVEALKLQKSDFDALLEKHPGMRELLERTAAERMAKESNMSH